MTTQVEGLVQQWGLAKRAVNDTLRSKIGSERLEAFEARNLLPAHGGDTRGTSPGDPPGDPPCPLFGDLISVQLAAR
jgi:hypothetical protein